MVDHTQAWQLRNAISDRLSKGTMTMEHLKAFVAMSSEDLDRIFPPKTSVPQNVQGEDGVKRTFGKGPSYTETN